MIHLVGAAHYNPDHIIQLDFFGLLPGVAGGWALRPLRGRDYFADLARKASARQPEGYKAELGRKGAAERRRRLYTQPHTVSYTIAGYRITERIVPWWPHQKNRQHRKRPVLVRIEWECVKLEESS